MNQEEKVQKNLCIPPGIESLSQTVFGKFFLKIGTLNYLHLDQRADQVRFKIKFWGDNGPGKMLVAKNSHPSLKEQVNSETFYEIRCSIWHFHKYIQDMPEIGLSLVDNVGNNLGNSIIKLFYLIKDHVTEVDKSIFTKEHMSGNYAIFDKQNNKIGEVVLTFSCVFDLVKSQIFKQISHAQEIHSPQQIDEILNSRENLNKFLGSGNISGQTLDDQKNYANSLKQFPSEKDYQPNLYQQKPEEPKKIVQSQNLIVKEAINNLNEIDKNQIKQQTVKQSPDQQAPQVKEQIIIPKKIEQKEKKQEKKDSKNSTINSKDHNSFLNAEREKKSKKKETKIQKIVEKKPLVVEQGLDKKLDQIFNLGNDLLVYLKNKDKIADQIKQYNLPLNNAPVIQGPFFESANKDQYNKLVLEQLTPIKDMNKEKEIEEKKLEEKKKQELEKKLQEEEEIKFQEEKMKYDRIYSQIKDKGFMEIKVIDFKSVNKDFLQRIKTNQIFIDISLPPLISEDEGKVIYSRNIISDTILFNQQVEYEPLFSRNKFQTLYSQNFKFKLYHRIQTSLNEIAQGELSFGRIASKTPDFDAFFNVRLYAKTSMNTSLKPQEDQQLGDLRVNIGITDTPPKKQKQEQKKQEIPLVPLQQQNVPLASTMPSQDPLFQLFLYLGEFKLFQKEKQNIFIKYKIYGSQDENQTQISWNTLKGDLQHNFILPVSRVQILKMANLPFMLQVWHKDIAKQNIVGMIRLDLSSIPLMVLDDQEQVQQNWKNPKNDNLLVKYNDFLPILDLKTQQEVGNVFTVLAFGDSKQINKFAQKFSKIPIKVNEDKENIKVEAPLLEKKKNPITERIDPYKWFDKFDLVQKQSEQNFNTLDVFIDTMEFIRKNYYKVGGALRNLIQAHNDLIITEDFYRFLIDLDIDLKGPQLFALVQLLDYRKQQNFRFDFFSKSYNKFLEYEGAIRNKYEKIIKNLFQILKDNEYSVNRFERELNKYLNMGYIKSEELAPTFQNLKLAGLTLNNIEELRELLDINNDGYIFISHLCDYLRRVQMDQTIFSVFFNYQWFLRELRNNVIQFFQQNYGRFDLEFKSEKFIDIEQLMHIFKEFGINHLSFWESFMMQELIKNEIKRTGVEQYLVNSEDLKQWIMILINETEKKTIREASERKIEKIQEEKIIPHIKNLNFFIYLTPKLINLTEKAQVSFKDETQANIIVVIDCFHKNIDPNKQFESIKIEQKVEFNKSKNFYSSQDLNITQDIVDYLQKKTCLIQVYILNFQTFEKYLIGGAEIPLSDLLNTGKIEGNEVINENDLQIEYILSFDKQNIGEQPQAQSVEPIVDQNILQDETLDDLNAVKHTFLINIINVTNLVLDPDYDFDDLYIQAQFPQHEKIEKTNPFEYTTKRKDYIIDQIVQYSYILMDQKIAEIFEEPIFFQLNCKDGDQILGSGLLEGDVISDLLVRKQTRCQIDLSYDGNSFAKLEIEITYKQEKQLIMIEDDEEFVEDHELIIKNIPKQVYIIFEFQVQAQHSPDLVLDLELDLFFSNKELQNQVKPLVAKVRGNKFRDVLKYKNQFFIEMNQQIINYLLQNQASISFSLQTPLENIKNEVLVSLKDLIYSQKITGQEDEGEVSFLYSLEMSKHKILNDQDINQQESLIYSLKNKYSSYYLIFYFDEILNFREQSMIYQQQGVLFLELLDNKGIDRLNSQGGYFIDLHSKVTMKDYFVISMNNDQIQDLFPSLIINIKAIFGDEQIVLGQVKIDLCDFLNEKEIKQDQFFVDDYFTASPFSRLGLKFQLLCLNDKNKEELCAQYFLILKQIEKTNQITDQIQGSLFNGKVRQDLDYQNLLVQNQNTVNNLEQEFLQLDRNKKGFILYEQAKELIQKSNIFLELKQQQLMSFQCVDKQFFDYILFLGKIQQQNQISQKYTIIDYKINGIQPQYRISRLKIEGIMCKNLGNLQQQLTPNCLVRCLEADFQTSVICRSSDAKFVEILDVRMEGPQFKFYKIMNFEIIHRKYNKDISKKISEDIVIGVAQFNLEDFFLMKGNQDAKSVQFNVPVKPVQGMGEATMIATFSINCVNNIQPTQQKKLKKNTFFLADDIHNHRPINFFQTIQQINDNLINPYHNDDQQSNFKDTLKMINTLEFEIQKPFQKIDHSKEQINEQESIEQQQVQNPFEQNMFSNHPNQADDKQYVEDIYDNQIEEEYKYSKEIEPPQNKTFNQNKKFTVRDNKEIDRIANIMNQKIEINDQFDHFSEDTDQ